MQRTAVINVVGLTNGLIGPDTPRLQAFSDAHSRAVIRPALPAVTCTAQSDYLTGERPSRHGIVANGWYDRNLAETQFWKQPDFLVGSPKIWDRMRAEDPSFTCAKMFWWYNMYSNVEHSVTPRPMYPSDGRKFFDIYAWPYPLRDALKKQLGEFPFFGFWGPLAGRDSAKGTADVTTDWIAQSALLVEEWHRPTLNLVYLPHLDYNLQRFGPEDARISKDLREIDLIVGRLIESLESQGVRVVLLSEYGITQVRRPIHLNREFRKEGWLTLKEELGRELLDFGHCKAFAVADHQVAHVYVKFPEDVHRVRARIEKVPGVAAVLGAEELQAEGLAHARCGDLVALAEEDAWFTYYYWEQDARAPDYARCVDIHRKPGYDPVELFFDPNIRGITLQVLKRLVRSRLGFRTLMDLIPLDARLIAGSHGIRPASQDHWPILWNAEGAESGELESTGVCAALEKTLRT